MMRSWTASPRDCGRGDLGAPRAALALAAGLLWLATASTATAVPVAHALDLVSTEGAALGASHPDSFTASFTLDDAVCVSPCTFFNAIDDFSLTIGGTTWTQADVDFAATITDPPFPVDLSMANFGKRDGGGLVEIDVVALKDQTFEFVLISFRQAPADIGWIAGIPNQTFDGFGASIAGSGCGSVTLDGATPPACIEVEAPAPPTAWLLAVPLAGLAARRAAGRR